MRPVQLGTVKRGKRGHQHAPRFRSPKHAANWQRHAKIPAMGSGGAKKRILARRRGHIGTYDLIAIAVVILGGLGMLGLFRLADITIVPELFGFRKEIAKLENEAVYGQIISAAVSLFGGSVALATFLITTGQKERHNAALEKRERDLAELQRIEAEFAALVDDFAQPETLNRINAAIGLGELACKPDPRRVEGNVDVMVDPREGTMTSVGDKRELLDRPRPWPAHWRSKKTELNYPYFKRAAHRLAAALYMWGDAPARAQALRVLREMGKWAKDKGTDEPLLHELANALAEANRTAWSQLRESAGMCLVADAEADLEGLLGLVKPRNEFEKKLKQRRIAREAYMTDLRAAHQQIPAVAAFASSPANQRSTPEDLKDQFVRAGQGFWATRDALATALRQFSEPPDLLTPGTTPPDSLERWAKVFRARRGLLSSNIRMLGANIGHVHFEGADIGHAHFEGANCSEAHFEGANCSKAHFEGADCSWAHFEGAVCTSAHFEGADCSWAHFEGAVCTSAHFEGAYCYGAHFEGANCSEAHFEEADCTWAHFEGANCSFAHFEGADCTRANFEGANCSEAHFEGAYCQFAHFERADCRWAHFEGADCRCAIFTGADITQADLDHQTRLARAQMGQFAASTPAKLSDSNWPRADFKHYEYDEAQKKAIPTDDYDEDLWNYLDQTYPVEDGERRLPPWEKHEVEDPDSELENGKSPEPEPESPD